MYDNWGNTFRTKHSKFEFIRGNVYLIVFNAGNDKFPENNKPNPNHITISKWGVVLSLALKFQRTCELYHAINCCFDHISW